MRSRRVMSTLASLGLAAALSVGGATAASATTSYMGGGWLDYGVDYGYMNVWSNYFHSSKSHGSTACNSMSCNRSDVAPANKWSWANIGATYGGNKSYYWFP